VARPGVGRRDDAKEAHEGQGQEMPSHEVFSELKRNDRETTQTEWSRESGQKVGPLEEQGYWIFEALQKLSCKKKGHKSLRFVLTRKTFTDSFRGLDSD
jgi:hypothetical protein